jgi:CRISPR-associated protein Csm2
MSKQSYERGRPSAGAGGASRHDQSTRGQATGLASSNNDKWIEQVLDGDMRTLVQRALEIARDELLKDRNDRVTTSQIRNIFGMVKRLEMNRDDPAVYQQLILIKPKLAYVAGRHNRISGLKYLHEILGTAIDLVGDDAVRFQNFCRFFEAILAYHKAHGGD